MAPSTDPKRVETLVRPPPPLEEDTDVPDLFKHKDSIDSVTFEQILEMDDDDKREFSREIVLGFFDQALATFKKMETALEEKNLSELSQLGHFLKGSSATLGLTKVKDACEKIQHFGAGTDEGGINKMSREDCLKNIDQTLIDVKKDYNEVSTLLRRFYGVDPKNGNDTEKD